MKVLLLGPSDTCPFFNFPAFDAAEMYLTGQGMVVFNQANYRRDDLQLPWMKCRNGHLVEDLRWTDEQCSKHSKSVMKWYMDRMCESDAVAMLPGSHKYSLPNLLLSFADRLGLTVMHLQSNTLDCMIRRPEDEEGGPPPDDDDEDLFEHAELE